MRRPDRSCTEEGNDCRAWSREECRCKSRIGDRTDLVNWKWSASVDDFRTFRGLETPLNPVSAPLLDLSANRSLVFRVLLPVVEATKTSSQHITVGNDFRPDGPPQKSGCRSLEAVSVISQTRLGVERLPGYAPRTQVCPPFQQRTIYTASIRRLHHQLDRYGRR